MPISWSVLIHIGMQGMPTGCLNRGPEGPSKKHGRTPIVRLDSRVPAKPAQMDNHIEPPYHMGHGVHSCAFCKQH